MLNTLLKIGEWQQEGMSEWDPILEKPSIKYQTGRGDSITNYIIGLVFDLDRMDVYPDPDLLKQFDEERDPEKFKLISILPGNNKAIYTTVESGKINQLFKTFFGRDKDEDVEEGQLIETIGKHFTEYIDSELHQLLKDIFPLRNKFLQTIWDEEKNKNDYKKILDPIELAKNEKIIAVYASIKSEDLDYTSPFPISKHPDYVSLLRDKFLNDKLPNLENEEKLCYASGVIEDDVSELDLATRYSLNKMFVSETKNYANNFNKKSFEKNYQISNSNQAKLDLASNFLLEKYKTQIANIDHVIIPQLKWSDDPDLDLVLDKLKINTDLLFKPLALNELAEDMDLEVEGIYWLNFLAFESDGNFLKTISVIKDVSKFHFQNVIKSFIKIDWEFYELQGIVDWDTVKKDYGEHRKFNLSSIYGIIPMRKDKEKKNIALLLFKTILEKRKVNTQQLFEFFSELILCHYYKRYSSYTNIRKYGKDYFDTAIRDSVFKYLAFIQVLKKLNLIDMEDYDEKNSEIESTGNYGGQILQFFEKMDFNIEQKAMFFLGRMLNRVVYMQQGKNKTVVNKINYNGMDRDDIMRLRIDLFEKAKQYNETGKIVFDDSNFGQTFNFDKWNMNPQEAVFFILTGYSYGIVKKIETKNKTD
jgi:CRISPR-associated protein Csh1